MGWNQVKVALSNSTWFSLSTKALSELIKINSDVVTFDFVNNFYGCTEWWRDTDDRWQDCWRRDRERLVPFEDTKFKCNQREALLYENDAIVYSFKNQEDKIFRIHPDVISVIEKLGNESFGNGCAIRVENVDFNFWDHWEIRKDQREEAVLVERRL